MDVSLDMEQTSVVGNGWTRPLKTLPVFEFFISPWHSMIYKMNVFSNFEITGCGVV